MNETIINKLIEFLKKNKLNLSSNSVDGRINSSINEDEILNILLKINKDPFFIDNEIIVEKAKEREWYDFKVTGKDIFIPINLKVSNLLYNNPDNTNCKLGIYYALTGINPKEKSINQSTGWNKYFKSLFKYIGTNKSKEVDYYFLIVNKNNEDDIFYTSLKSINTLTANGNNLPFQAVWNNNRVLVDRTFEESKAFLLESFKSSIDKINIKNSFYENMFESEIYKKITKVLTKDYNDISFEVILDKNVIIIYHNSKEKALDAKFIKELLRKIYKISLDYKVIINYDILEEYIKEGDNNGC